MQVGLGLLAGLAARLGLPRSGLVAWYDCDHRNLLRHSEDFTPALWSKSVTLTAGAALAPDGTLAATRVEDTSATANHLLQQDVSVVSDTRPRTLSVYLKPETAAQTLLNLRYVGGTTVSVDALITWSSLSISNGVLEAVGDGWYRAWLAVTNNGSGNTTARVQLYPAGWQSGGVGTGSVLVWGAQLNAGSQPLPYQRTTDNQQLIDTAGSSLHGTLGSTAGADTNDPRRVTWGLSFDGVDDRVDVAHNAALNLTRWTAIAVLRPTTASQTTGARVLHKIGAGTNINYFLGYDNTDGTRLRALATYGGTAAQAIGTTQVTDTARWYMVTGRDRDTAIDLFVGEALEASTAKSGNPDTNSVPLRLGHDATLGTVGARVDLANVLLYARALSGAEVRQVYRALQRRLAPRGISL